MKLKEKLAIAYSKAASKDFAYIPKEIIRQNAYLAGFDVARNLIFDLIYDHSDNASSYEFNLIGNAGEEEVDTND